MLGGSIEGAFMDLDEKGLATRRAVLGDAYVDSVLGKATAVTEPLQELVTRHAWGNTWQRVGIDLRTRSIVSTTSRMTVRLMPSPMLG
jgi:4-carboxymuconolactone decarboxylase